MEIRGQCWKFGDNVPTDQIVTSDRALLSLEEMAQHVLENLNPDFPKAVQRGDILVGGKHFGQSSGRAVAPKALQATGLGAIVVEYAARLFYRNCFEIGLPLLECPGITAAVEEGDVLSIDMVTGVVQDETRGISLQANAADPFLMRMLESGGLIPMAKELAESTEAGSTQDRP